MGPPITENKFEARTYESAGSAVRTGGNSAEDHLFHPCLSDNIDKEEDGEIKIQSLYTRLYF